MANSATLLPPNATRLETALATALARVSDIPVPLAPLWDPATCPLRILPWLAYGLSTDQWRQEWSEERKREAVAQAIPTARVKGSRAAAMAVLCGYDAPLSISEWWQTGGAPYTFTVTLEISPSGGASTTAAFAAELYRDLTRVKPVRAHFALRQSVAARTTLPITGAVRALRYERLRFTAQTPAMMILSEDGALLQAESGQPLETE